MSKVDKNEITIRSSAAEYLTYVASIGDESSSMEMRYEDEDIWLTQKMMATLYDVDVRTINYPEFDTSKKRKNRKQAQKISILCGFFELFLLTNTENHDIIYLI